MMRPPPLPATASEARAPVSRWHWPVRTAALNRAENGPNIITNKRGISMPSSVLCARKPIFGPLALLLCGLAAHPLWLPSAFAEQQDGNGGAATREWCERDLNIAKGRIEGLEAMLDRAQRDASGHQAGAAGRDSNAWDLVDRLLALNAARTEQGIRLSLPQEELVFRSGTTELPSGEMPSLDEIAALLAENPEMDALIEGHTDSAGPTATNMALSQERADAVRQALIDRGVEPKRLAAEGIGESQPVATNATSAGRRENRRVEIYLAR